MKIELKKFEFEENRWEVVGENGSLYGKVEKDGYGIWFEPYSKTSFYATELFAIAQLIMEIEKK
jgi:hypothetical protein